MFDRTLTLPKKCPYSEFFWSVFSRIRTEYGGILRDTARIRENADQKNSEYGHFSRSVKKRCLLLLSNYPPFFYYLTCNDFCCLQNRYRKIKGNVFQKIWSYNQDKCLNSKKHTWMERNCYNTTSQKQYM